MISLIVWQTTNDAALGLYMSIFTDIIGFSPTIIKSVKQPFTEDPKFYASDMFAGFFGLLSLKSYMLFDAAFPLYLFVINFIVVAILYIKRRNAKNENTKI